MAASYHGSGRGSQGSGGRSGNQHRGGRGRESSGGHQNSSRKDCFKYKLLGECERHEAGECQYSHINRVGTKRETIKVPAKVPLTSAKKGDFLRGLSDICEYCLQVSGENTIDIVVSENNAEYLPLLCEKYENLLSQVYPIGPGWCYIHRDGVSQCKAGSMLTFREHRGRVPLAPGRRASQILRELLITDVSKGESEDSESKPLAVKNPEREYETKGGLQKALNSAHGPTNSITSPSTKQKDVLVKIIEDHEDHMRGILQGALEWFRKEKRKKEQYALKLEARFGKVLWIKLPEDVVESSLDIRTFADLCFSDTRHSRIFNTLASRESIGKLKESFGEDLLPSVLVTLDMKFTVKNQEKRVAVDARIKFDENNKPILLLAKKNESKIVIFDVLSLHRQYDVRMSLNYYEIIREGFEYDMVQKLLKTVSRCPEAETVSFQSQTTEWSVNFIRYKKREAFRIDEKLLLTATNIQEYQDPQNDLFLADHNAEPHIEVEFHNCAWECAFGRDVGLTKDTSLSLHMANPEVEPQVERAIPDPWLPEHILEDFKDFWENLDSLNEILSDFK